MKRRVIFVASVLSLIFVGTSGKAAWASDSQESDSAQPQAATKLFDTGKGYVELFGRTFCAADAPATAACDWRMPKAEPKHDPVAANESRTVTILGKHICFGHSGTDDDCWLRFPAVKDQKGERRASL